MNNFTLLQYLTTIWLLCCTIAIGNLYYEVYSVKLDIQIEKGLFLPEKEKDNARKDS